MRHNLGFQERWDFRRKEVNKDSSSDDDSKSNSEQVLKSWGLIVEDDYHGDNPTQIEPEEGNPRTKSKSKCKKLRKIQQPRVTKRNKLVNEKTEHVTVKNPRGKKKNGFAYDSSLMKDFKSFSESLLEDMKAAGEKMFVKMKEEMFELQSSEVSIASNGSTKVGYAQVLSQRNVRYAHNQMLPRQEDTQIQGMLELNRNYFAMNNMIQLPTSGNTNAVCDFPLVHHQQGWLLDRGLPNTSLNRPFIMSGGSEGTPNMQIHLNSEPSVYPPANIVNLQPSGRVDCNVQDMIRQNSLSSFTLGILSRNEARDQSHMWRATYEREMMEVERMRNFKALFPFMNDGKRQLQAMEDERAAFHGNFSGPIMLQQRDNEQTGGLLYDPKFSANLSSRVASSKDLTFPDKTPNLYIKSQIIRPSSIQHITSGNQAVMNGGSTRMKAEESIRNGYLGMERNNIRSIPQVGNSDGEQCSAPNCSIGNS